MGKSATRGPGVFDDAHLIELARATKRRLEFAIAALDDEEVDEGDDELAFWRGLVRRTYHAAFGNERTMRWLTFVRAVEAETIRQAKERTVDATVARRVVERYARVFPDLAAALVAAKVEAAVIAWRTDRNQWKAVRAALLDVAPMVPTPRSMATQWSRKTKRVPGVQSRKRRPPKRRR